MAELRAEERGWTLDVLTAVRGLNREHFLLDDIYSKERDLAALHPANRHVRDKIRQQLQVLRDKGLLEFWAREISARGLAVGGTPAPHPVGPAL